jgi:hypothetical protein
MIPEPSGIVSRPFARTLSIGRALLKLAPTGWAVCREHVEVHRPVRKQWEAWDADEVEDDVVLVSSVQSCWPGYAFAARLNTRATTRSPSM